jgi:pimeloyl-ACP methyl ester carboxylesterase
MALEMTQMQISSVLMSRIPYEIYSSQGHILHFAHANGYPPNAYLPLFEQLKNKFQVLAMYQRPLWPGTDPQMIQDWEPFAADLKQFLDEQNLSGITGVGHSVGGTTTLRLALEQPERFTALVLLDPVIFPPLFTPLWNSVFRLGIPYSVHPLARTALKRRQIYPDRQAIFDSYRQKSVFKRIDDRGLWAYVNAIAGDRPDGQVELIFSSDWEARVYVTGARTDQALWHDLTRLRPPLLILRGEKSSTFSNYTARLIQNRLPRAVIVNIPQAGHLVPLEKPVQVTSIMQEFLEEHAK